MPSLAKQTTDGVDFRPHISPRRAATIIALWIAGLAIGFAFLIQHDLQAGSGGGALRRWPAASSLVPAEAGPTLVMFIHPHCPCTAASLEQLAAILDARAPRSAAAYLLVADVAASDTGENVTLARRIPGAGVRFDLQNVEAKRFGCQTSGTLFIFDAAGRLVFQGGITAGRGHQGQNPAAAAALAALQGSHFECVRMPVFGCALAREQRLAGE